MIPKFLKRPAQGPSEEAVKARDRAKEISQRADVIYHERRYLTERNHFADRIRMIYEGH